MSVATAQAPPEELLPPLVELVSPTSVKIMTQPPGQPNGIITSYILRLLGTELKFDSDLPQEFVVNGSFYHFQCQLVLFYLDTCW